MEQLKEFYEIKIQDGDQDEEDCISDIINDFIYSNVVLAWNIYE